MIGAVLMFASPVAAEETGSGVGPQDAKVLFDEGLRYMLNGDLKMGCAFIKQSLDVDPRPGTLFTLAECYGRAGRYASAVERYDEYLAEYARMDPADKEAQRARAEVSRKERTRMMNLVPWLTVVLPADAPERVDVTMDGEPFDPSLFDVALAIDPGSHRFTTRAPGGPLVETQIELEPSTRRRHVLEIHGGSRSGSLDGSEFDGPADDYSFSSSPRAPWVYAVGGIGAAGLITGAISGVLLLDKRRIVRAQCTDELPGGDVSCGDPNDPKAQEALAAARTAQNTLAPLTTVALGVGVGGLAAAAILYFTDSPKRRGRSSGGVSASAAVGPGLATVNLSGRF
jgi:tetratricopeptide (TPR) repeat protein